MTQPEALPPYFYKYRSLAGETQREFLRDILLRNRLYWPSPKQFNDPFDCSPIPTLSGTRKERKAYVDRLIREHMKGHPRFERRKARRRMSASGFAGMEANLNTIFRDRLAQVGVCSLAEEGDNILMWSHYADSHRGVCLRFRPSQADRDFYLAFRVAYSPDRPIVHVMRASANEWFEGALLTKAEGWAYEREWRQIDVEHVGFHDFRPEALDAVILGALIRPEDEQMVRELVMRRRPRTQLLKATFDDSHFRININPAE